LTPITPLNLIKHELIGLNINIIRDTNPYNKSISGTVIDESRNTLTIKQGDTPKMVPKRNALFSFTLPSSIVEVSGTNLVGRPEDRVKKNLKRRW